MRPTPTQERELKRVLWCCRTPYNAALEQRITAWQRCHVSLTRSQQEAELKAIRAELPDYAAIHSHVLQDVLARLDTTYQAFFRRLAAGEKPGFPRFQGCDRWHSFIYKEYGNGARLENGYLALSKIGHIAVRWSRPVQVAIKTVTISREADGWYVLFSCVQVPIEPLPLTGRETGIDVGLKVFLVTADGHPVAHPRHYRMAERALKKAQVRVSRRTKGSHRRRKAVQVLAKQHQQVRRQRQDVHHKTALALLLQHDIIYLEDLRVRNMVRNSHPAKSISDAGWAAFRTILDAKAAWAGRQVIAVPAQYTSQDCSGVLPDGSRCLQRVPKSLSVRTHVGPVCGLVMDRDQNAALNILRAGQARQGAGAVAAALN